MEVVHAGPLSLTVDQGRIGYHRMGITTGGPMDKAAFDSANRLLGNPPGSCALEVTLGGLVLVCKSNLKIAITGPDLIVTLNANEIPTWQVIDVKKGDVLEVQQQSGVRSYVAAQGGFDVPLQFGSATTVVRESLGGLKKNGEPLKSGDLLFVSDNDCSTSVEDVSLPASTAEAVLRLRVITGYQFDDFSKIAINRFFNSEFCVSPKMDRMAVRLQGPGIASPYTNLVSEGITFGAIQIPADGQPIIMLNDRQTIGGYPKLGSVFSQDCDKLAQCRPGTKLRFEQISIFDAHNLLHLRQCALNNLR